MLHYGRAVYGCGVRDAWAESVVPRRFCPGIPGTASNKKADTSRSFCPAGQDEGAAVEANTPSRSVSGDQAPVHGSRSNSRRKPPA